MYFWVKTFHLLFVIAWMAAVFYLPRILVNLTETRDQPEVQGRLLVMGKKLYRFGHSMFGLAAVLGLVLWFGYRFLPNFQTMVAPGTGWMHAKLTLVALMLAHYIIAGRWLKGVEKGKPLPSSLKLRLFNEAPVFLLVATIYLVLAKPF